MFLSLFRFYVCSFMIDAFVVDHVTFHFIAFLTAAKSSAPSQDGPPRGDKQKKPVRIYIC